MFNKREFSLYCLFIIYIAYFMKVYIVPEDTFKLRQRFDISVYCATIEEFDVLIRTWFYLN